MGAKRRFVLLGIRSSSLVAALISASSVRAQATLDDNAAADGLYKDALELMGKEDFSHACPKLVASYKLRPKPGVLFRLAECYSASHDARACQTWERVILVSRKAEKKGKVDEALKALGEIKPNAPKLVIEISPDSSSLSGVVVKWNGQELDSGNLGHDKSICVAPGEQVVEASAPGRLPFTAKVIFPDTPQNPPHKETITISLPEDTSLSRSRGLLFGALGLSFGAAVSLALGGGFGADATSKWNAATSSCSHLATPTESCPPASVVLGNSAGTNADFSTGFFAAGGVLGAGAIATWLVYAMSPPAPRPSSWTLRPLIGSSSGGALIQGSF